MAVQILSTNSSLSIYNFSLKCRNAEAVLRFPQAFPRPRCPKLIKHRDERKLSVQCSGNQNQTVRTCKNCKTQFDPSINHPRACRHHTAHFGGETKRKFESVYTGGTLDTPNSGKISQYWHCCGSEDPFDPGCTAAPHASYDD
ncbi:hypothetical protein CASFOL_018221 [Castilleja foliolosa]|uniref:Uncharacterized protein n=1 Tax=Castilleja foliolosa TaxID=1961234 RepID=A0ABD3D6S9_9LAMI